MFSCDNLFHCKLNKLTDFDVTCIASVCGHVDDFKNSIQFGCLAVITSSIVEMNVSVKIYMTYMYEAENINTHLSFPFGFQSTSCHLASVLYIEVYLFS